MIDKTQKFPGLPFPCKSGFYILVSPGVCLSADPPPDRRRVRGAAVGVSWGGSKNKSIDLLFKSSGNRVSTAMSRHSHLAHLPNNVDDTQLWFPPEWLPKRWLQL
jgi:hypothetical protein